MVHSARVLQRSLGLDRKVVGWYDNNSQLNYMVYDLEFPDGTIKEYRANKIAEIMLTQVDSDGFTLTMMEGIIGHYKDKTTAISKEDKYVSCP